MTLLNRAVAAFAVPIALGGADPSRAVDSSSATKLGFWSAPGTNSTRTARPTSSRPGRAWQLTPLAVLSAGAGAGFLDESPQFRFLVGVQHTLTFLPNY